MNISKDASGKKEYKMNNMRKLMEAVKPLSEEYVEYRDPDGEFQVIYDFPRGYFAVGKNDAKQDISGESFDDLDDAIEHAEICLSIGNDVYEDQFVDEEIDDLEEKQRSISSLGHIIAADIYASAKQQNMPIESATIHNEIAQTINVYSNELQQMVIDILEDPGV